ncbi:MAG: LPS-assembly protein LptD [Nitrospirae bacterium]|nr:LPS-assembly protein LptD [Nitrospirota bacterium]
MSIRIFVIITLFAFAQTESISAQEFLSTSDILEIEGSTYTLIGNVTSHRDNTLLKADEMIYNNQTYEADLKGNVSYEDEEISIKADNARLNLEEQTGILNKAEIFVKKDNYYIRAKQVEKKKGKRYILRSASITTCDAKLPAWCMRARGLDIIFGDRLIAKSVSLNIKGIPLIYTPYLWAPILTERKTGFLFPSLGYSESKGFFVRQPFFWAIRENRDATFFLDIYSKRGLGKAIEYRYIERQDIKGRLYLYHLKDRVLKKDFTEARLTHESGIPDKGIWGYLNLNLINQREFPRLYRLYLEDRSKRFMESSTEVSTAVKTSRLYLRGTHTIELKDAVRQSTVSQRLPELGFVLNPIGIGHFLKFSFQGTATNFWRPSNTSQRFSLNARLSHSAGKTLTLGQTLNVRETLYYFDEQDRSQSRQSAEYKAVLYHRFIKKYSSITHSITPSISYRYIFRNRRSLPVFDGLELNPPQTEVEITLINRLIDKKGQFLVFKASEVSDSSGKNSLLIGLHTDRLLRIRANAAYDLDEGALDYANSELSVDVSRKAVFSMGQNYTRQSNVFLHTFGVGYTHSKALFLDGKLWYDSKEGTLNNMAVGLSYMRQCWGMNVQAIRSPDDFSVFLTIALKGLSSFKVMHGAEEEIFRRIAR